MYLEASGFAVCVVMNFGQEGSSESRFVEFVELIVDKPEQETTFSDTTVSDDNNFDVTLILIHKFLISNDRLYYKLHKYQLNPIECIQIINLTS
jgi:uncharacterized protein YfbU (UPF0304 family)